MSAINICPICGLENKKSNAFCTGCGCRLITADAVTVNINPNSGESKTSSLKKNLQALGQRAQLEIYNASNVISDKAKEVSSRASNIVVEEKVTEAMANLVNLMINVSNDVTKQIPTEMLNAIDLEAEINFVAFTIGVSIDLAELNKATLIKMKND